MSRLAFVYWCQHRVGGRGGGGYMKAFCGNHLSVEVYFAFCTLTFRFVYFTWHVSVCEVWNLLSCFRRFKIAIVPTSAILSELLNKNFVNL